MYPLLHLAFLLLHGSTACVGNQIAIVILYIMIHGYLCVLVFRHIHNVHNGPLEQVT